MEAWKRTKIKKLLHSSSYWWLLAFYLFLCASCHFPSWSSCSSFSDRVTKKGRGDPHSSFTFKIVMRNGTNSCAGANPKTPSASTTRPSRSNSATRTRSWPRQWWPLIWPRRVFSGGADWWNWWFLEPPHATAPNPNGESESPRPFFWG